MARIAGWFGDLGRRAGVLLRREKFDSEMDEEMRLHRDMKQKELEAEGIEPEEAGYMAQREMGNALRLREESRDAWGWNWLEQFFQDARLALRQLRKSPGFTAVAILTLALGIGANTAVFTLVHAVLLKSLPVQNPSQLYSLGDTRMCCDTTDFADIRDNFALFSYPLYKQLRDNTPEFSELAAFQTAPANLSVRRSGVSTPAEPFFGEIVSGNYFTTFGVGAYAGRTLMPEDDRPTAAPVAVMSYRAWHLHYGDDPSVIGQTFALNGLPTTIVGIAAPGFYGDSLKSDPPDFWVPLAMEPPLSPDNAMLNQTNHYWMYLIGRLKPGVPAAQAQAHVILEIRQWLTNLTGLSEYSRQLISKIGFGLNPAGSGVTRMRDSYGEGLRLLMMISGLVLLIACANIANLLLARSTANRLQNAVRLALGAARGRLIRQMVTEGLVLALLGGMAGIAVAFAGTRAILLLTFRGANYVPIEATPSLPVLAFAFGISLVTGLIFSFAPAWIASNAHPADSLRGAGRSTGDTHATSQKLLVIAQAGLSLVLLVGAGLLIQSLRNLEHQKFGFEPEGRLIVRVRPASAGYTLERLPALYRVLEERLSSIPGVRSASLALTSPLAGWNFQTPVFIAGRAPSANPSDDMSFYDFVSAHFFEAIGNRIVRGRALNEQDTPTAHHVAVVNETFARKFFPNQDPLGHSLGISDASHGGDYEIVGVAEDAKFTNAKNPVVPMFFMPLLQIETYKDPDDQAYQIWANYIDSIQLSVAGRPENYQRAVQQTLADIDPNLTVQQMMTFQDMVNGSFNSPRLMAQLTTLYGIVALILASIGLYGVAAYMVARRTSEIGIRMALGAQRVSVMGMVLRSAMQPIGLGLLVGVPVALIGGHAIASQLYGVKGYDPLILIGAVAVLTAAAVLAAIVPARRAASIDPIRALRNE
jgi:predicted permease